MIFLSYRDREIQITGLAGSHIAAAFGRLRGFGASTAYTLFLCLRWMFIPL